MIDINQSLIAEARELLSNFQNLFDFQVEWRRESQAPDFDYGRKFYPCNPQSIMWRANEIRELLSRAGVDAAALDPTGERTAEEMDHAIRDAIARAAIAGARDSFEIFKADLPNPYLHPSWRASLEDTRRLMIRDGFPDVGAVETSAEKDLNKIRELLSMAGVDAAALDPTGERTAEEMEECIAQAIDAACIRNARSKLNLLETSPNTLSHEIPRYVDEIRELLSMAGVDAAVLDPTGEHTAEEMEKRITHAPTISRLNSDFLDISRVENCGRSGEKEATVRQMVRAIREQFEAVVGVIRPVYPEATNFMEGKIAALQVKYEL